MWHVRYIFHCTWREKRGYNVKKRKIAKGWATVWSGGRSEYPSGWTKKGSRKFMRNISRNVINTFLIRLKIIYFHFLFPLRVWNLCKKRVSVEFVVIRSQEEKEVIMQNRSHNGGTWYWLREKQQRNMHRTWSINNSEQPGWTESDWLSIYLPRCAYWMSSIVRQEFWC